MKPLIYNFDAQTEYAEALCQTLQGEIGQYELRHFPDGETYVRILNDCSRRLVVVLANLHNPDPKFLSLAYLSNTARDLGASSVILATPYLPYMRQDIRFHDGEGITSRYFAKLISSLFDGLATIDPHLHRFHHLDEIYSIPSRVVHADDTVARWISYNIDAPVIVGPDEESEQWVRQVAERVGCDVLVLRKTRLGDRDVRIEIPDLEKHNGRTPVLVDDIISTGRTMLQTAQHLVNAGLPAPHCIGIHGVFAPEAFREMTQGPIARVVTGNTIPHESNLIHLEDVLARAVLDLIGGASIKDLPLGDLPIGQILA